MPLEPRVKFAPDPFQRRLRARVERYLRMTGRSARDCASMYAKTAIVFAWAVGSYLALVFVAAAWWQALPLVASLGLATAAIGFNVQHDGSHQAYSSRRWINAIMARTLDLVGASSFVWARKHNTIHHTFTNIAGWDDDIDVGLLGRLSPDQRRLGVHRFQHFYLWLLYAFLPLKWQWWDDFREIVRGRVGAHRIARPHGLELALFVLGKAVFFGYALVLPLTLHPAWAVILCYLGVCWTQGLVLSVVFQMAHVVEEAGFPAPDAESGRMEQSWAVHQITTTVDFARDNRALSWYVGGLNFQVEHHLFPRICHVHYPRIARIVERACRREGIPYRANPTLGAAIRSHYRWLRQMGRPVPQPA